MSCNSSFSQTPVVDSLVHALSSKMEHSERNYLLNEISSSLKDINSNKSLTYAQSALQLSELTNDKENEIRALNNIGNLVYDSDKRDSALAYFEKGERMARELKFKELQADHLMSLANWYRYYEKDSTKTVQYLQKSIVVSKEANYNYGTARSYAKLASFYTRYKEILLCETYLKFSAEYYLKVENGEIEIAHYYDEVANKIWDYNPKKSMDLYYTGLQYSDNYPHIMVSLANAHNIIGEPEIALQYLKDALPNLDSKDHGRMKGIATAQLADVYLQLGDCDAALDACNNGIDILESLTRRYRRALPSLYRTKGKLMELNGDTKIALELYTKSLEAAEKNREIFEVTKGNIVLGKFYYPTAPKKTEQYCKIALQKASENNLTSLGITACDCLFNIYEAEKNYSKAIQYFEQKVMLSDSLGTLKIEHAIDINSKITEKDKEVAKESYLKEIKEEEVKNKNIVIRILAMSSILGLMLIGFLFLSIKKITRQNSEIKRKTDDLEGANKNLARSNEELERFAHIASHDLKSPLITILSFTELINRKLESKRYNTVKEWLGIIDKSGRSMSILIDDILEYSKLSSQALIQNDNEVVNVNKLIGELSQLILINPEREMNNIEASNIPDIRWSKSKLFLLFKNIIENGLKYNESENPTVKIFFSKSKGINSIHFEDNGIGIKQEYFDKIFNLFHRLHNQSTYEGTGLGLATCKKIVEDFKGKIDIKSTIGKGTSFIIQIPEILVC